MKKCPFCGGKSQPISGKEAANSMLDAFGVGKNHPTRSMMVGSASSKVTDATTKCSSPECNHLDLFGINA